MSLSRIVAPVAAVGFGIATLSSLLFWFDVDLLGDYGMVLFIGMIAVHVPSVFLMQRLQAQAHGRFSWKVAFTGAPRWMYPLSIATFTYAMINFFLPVLGLFASTEENFMRVGSSHAMVFYVLAWGLATAELGRAEQGIRWECERGHAMSPSVNFCGECGAPVRKG